MKALTTLCGVAALTASIALFASESRTRRELGELQTAAANKAADRKSFAAARHHEAPRMTLAQEQEQVLVAYGREGVDPTWRPHGSRCD